MEIIYNVKTRIIRILCNNNEENAKSKNKNFIGSGSIGFGIESKDLYKAFAESDEIPNPISSQVQQQLSGNINVWYYGNGSFELNFKTPKNDQPLSFVARMKNEKSSIQVFFMELLEEMHNNDQFDINDVYFNGFESMEQWLKGYNINSDTTTYALANTAKNGLCLFHSLRLCYLVAKRPSKTCKQLLDIVFDTFLDENNEKAKSVLLSWYTLLNSCKMEYNSKTESIRTFIDSVKPIIAQFDNDCILQCKHLAHLYKTKEDSNNETAQNDPNITPEIFALFTQFENLSCTEAYKNIKNCDIMTQFFDLLFTCNSVQQMMMFLSKVEIILKRNANEEYYAFSRDYSHAKFLLDYKPDSNGTFPLVVRKALIDNLKKTNEYWGEEYALQVLKESLDINLLVIKPVINSDSSISMRGQFIGGCDNNAANWKEFENDASDFIVLYLSNSHYTPLMCYTDQNLISIFKYSQLPQFVKDAFHKKI